MNTMCECNQGRLPCDCRPIFNDSHVLAAISKKAHATLAAYTESGEIIEISKWWKVKMSWAAYEHSHEIFWCKDLRLHAKLRDIKSRAEINAKGKPRAKFDISGLRKSIPEILIPDAMFKLACELSWRR